jgi:Ca2+/Na+ antiporter
MTRTVQLFNFPALLLLISLLFFFMKSDRRISRTEGAGLLACYGGYVAALVVMTLTGRA